MIRIERELEYARIALTHALSNHELQGPLALIGYGPERLQQGMALYLAAVDRVRTQTNAYEAKVTATQEFYNAWAAARLRYARDLGTMRVILRNQPDQSCYLQLPGKRISSFVGWHAQARCLYEGIQERADLQELLDEVGFTSAQMADGLQALEAVRLARLLQVEAKGAAKLARERSSEALTALRDWIELFGISARKALAAMPGQLVSLGVDVTLNQERRRKLELKKKRAAAELEAAALGE